MATIVTRKTREGKSRFMVVVRRENRPTTRLDRADVGRAVAAGALRAAGLEQLTAK